MYDFLVPTINLYVMTFEFQLFLFVDVFCLLVEDSSETLSIHMYVSTPAGDLLLVDQVLTSSLLTITVYDCWDDLISLDVDIFDAILGMY